MRIKGFCKKLCLVLSFILLVSGVSEYNSLQVYAEEEETAEVWEDGYYQISIDGYSGLNATLTSYVDIMFYDYAMLEIRDGNMYMTTRVSGYQLLENFFVIDQKYMKLYRESGETKSYVPNASLISNDHPGKETWISKGVLSEEDNDYYLDKSQLQVTAYDDMGYADVTFPIKDINQEMALWMFPLFEEGRENNTTYSWMFLEIDESTAIKLNELPEDGEYIWSPTVSDGTRKTSTSSTVAYTALVQSCFGERAEVNVSGDRAAISLEVSDAEKVSDVQVMTQRDQSVTHFNYQTGKKSYQAADYESVYDEGSLSFTMDVTSYADLVFGKRIMVVYNNVKYYGCLSFVGAEVVPVYLEDEESGIGFDTNTLNVPLDASLNVAEVQEGHENYNKITSYYGGGAFKAYTAWDISVLNNKGNTTSVKKSGTLKFPVPEGANSDKLVLWKINTVGDCMRQTTIIEDGYLTLETSQMGVYILSEGINYISGDQLEDGTYEINISVWKTLEETLSMSNDAFENPVTMVVKDGVKTIYSKLNSVSSSSMTSYLAHMWIYADGVTYTASGYPQGDKYSYVPYQYYRNPEDAEQFYTDAFNEGTLRYYPEYMYFQLPNNDSEIPVRFSVPVMDALGGGDFSQDARFCIDYSSALKISDETLDEPIGDALKEAILIAETAIMEEYTAGSWDALDEAYEEALNIYESDDSANFENAYNKLETAIDALTKVTEVTLDQGLYIASAVSTDADIITDTRVLVNEVGYYMYLGVDGIKNLAYYDQEQAEYVTVDRITVTDDTANETVTGVSFTNPTIYDTLWIKYKDTEGEIYQTALTFSEFTIQNVNKETLTALLNQSNTLLAEAAEDSGKYEANQVTALQSAVATAAEVYNNTVSLQSEVDAQSESLQDAIGALTLKVNLKALEEAISKAEAIDSASYTPNSYQSLTKAIATSKELLDKADVTGQEVEAQILVLNAAVEGLIERADKSELTKAYEEAAAITDIGYANWDDLQTVLAETKNVLENENATQNEVDAQAKAIKAAVTNLTGGIDKTALAEIIDKAEEIDTSSYTDESVAYLSAAITSAKEVLNSASATQQQIDKQILLIQSASAALIQKTEENVVYKGTYTINGILRHASADQDSMGNAALVKPMELIVDDDQILLRLKFQPLTASLGTSTFTGYLSAFNYFPGWEGGDSGYALPQSETPVAANVESYYEGIYDEYNDPDTGIDANIKGKLYPQYMTIPIELGDDLIWAQVYVPVMEAISTGSGLQYAKLVLDWGSLEQQTGVDTDKAALKELIAQAEELLNSVGEDAALEQAIKLAQSVLDNLNVDQDAVDAVAAALKDAMNVYNEEEVVTDKSELKKAIEVADTYLNEKDITYTATTLAILQTARNQAQAVYDNEQATQTQVNNCVTAIDNAIQGLVTDGTDKRELKKALETTMTYLKASSDYTGATLEVLNSLYETALSVYENSESTQEEIDAQIRILNYAIENLKKVVEASVDKTGLQNLLQTALNMAGREALYTADSINSLKETIKAAVAVYNDESATQAEVNEQASALVMAMVNLSQKDTGNNSNDNTGDNSNDNNNNDNNNDNTNDNTNKDLDINNLEDGVYYVTGKMVKVDKTTASMSNDAIDHSIKLTVKDGKYYLTMTFKGLTVSSFYGYLGDLKYYTDGYTLDNYGSPQGTLNAATIDTYQLDSSGNRISDSFGTDYPEQVTYPLISQALSDSYVPLQVFVPIMESISAGTGTQPVFLKLDWSTISATKGEEDPDPDDENNGNSDNNDTNDNSGDNTNDNTNDNSNDNTNNNTNDNTNNNTNNDLDINNLEDGMYYVTGKMVKVDKTTASMSNDAIDHSIKLTVKDGKYYLTMTFKGLTVSSFYGYLGALKYYADGYTLDNYGSPQGTLNAATIDTYQEDSSGNRISDSFGTNYPEQVTYPLISQA
ncbi:MAG: NEAT domain-containing protein, partial [Lachnospiraceae bacterium]